jgi:AAA ATPase domain
MRGGSGRHDELAGELVEWWQDLWQRGMTSRVVLVAVPPGWGRTTVLDHLTEAAAADDAPVTFIARIPGRALPEDPGAQGAVLRDCLAQAAARHRVAELLGLDRLGGITQLGLGVGGLFVSGLAGAVGFLVAGVALGAAGKAWDDSPAGQDGALARTARAVAEASTHVPVVVVIDDADFLDEDLAVTLIENLAARHDGHVLVAAAADPAGSLRKALVSRARQGITEGLVHIADADPDMSYESRADLTRELLPHLPETAVRRIARSTATFKDVFTVTSAPRVTEPGGQDEAQLLADLDDITAALLQRPGPSPEAVVTAWSGGLLHARQAARAMAVLGQPPAHASDPDLLRAGNLQRVTGPGTPRLAGRVAAMARRDRQAMAGALLDEALRIAEDPRCGLAEQVAAAQARPPRPRRPRRPRPPAPPPAPPDRRPGGARRARRRTRHRGYRAERRATRRQRPGPGMAGRRSATPHRAHPGPPPLAAGSGPDHRGRHERRGQPRTRSPHLGHHRVAPH